MILFTLATFSPVVLILLAAFWPGVWGWLALGYMTVLVFTLDRLIEVYHDDANPESEFPCADNLLISLGFAHFTLLAAGLWAVAGGSGLSGLERGVLAVALALVFGQISHPVAHELIHNSGRAMRLLGRLIYSSILFGHHASAHLRVHHSHVASRNDPSSARLGEGFYAYVWRAWPGAFWAGLQAESKLRAGQTGAWRHPYFLYIGMAAATIASAGILLGAIAVGALIIIAIYAQLQILMSDYVQHYGLTRVELADGSLEPVGLRHSWNAPQWFSSAVTLNAPRHSDHHVKPARPFPALRLDDRQMPFLPYSLPVMAAIALVPPVWRRIMDPLCDTWHPAWDKRGTVGAGSLSPAVLARTKTGGLDRAHLPVSGHATFDPDAVPLFEPHRPGVGPKRDDGGRV